MIAASQMAPHSSFGSSLNIVRDKDNVGGRRCSQCHGSEGQGWRVISPIEEDEMIVDSQIFVIFPFRVKRTVASAKFVTLKPEALQFLQLSLMDSVDVYLVSRKLRQFLFLQYISHRAFKDGRKSPAVSTCMGQNLSRIGVQHHLHLTAHKGGIMTIR
ncbi:hypothetical protein ElyMa_000012900 [Elysia marginata]|uniref:Cytochrome c domain-containing protein n=1 Tax=Elysia marginata TaxID=1093978 RepID=A0AAV4EBR4_9GAST|nr:hypothetical protein ElyMa_000012900 [Elysia marginata]